MNTARRKPTVVVDLRGGLANQLFQWGAAVWLRSRHDFDLILDARAVSRPNERGNQLGELGLESGSFRTASPFAIKGWQTAFSLLPSPLSYRISSVARPSTRVSAVATLQEADARLRSGKSVILAGFFQDAERLTPIRDQLKSLAVPGLTAKASKIPQGSYAAIHVRRGDYVSSAQNLEKFGICSADYYLSASELLNCQEIRICSDDPDWCKSHLAPTLSENFNVTVSESNSHFDDLLTIARANEVVMANSTFSWWGVFLGSPAQVIAPSNWANESHLMPGTAPSEWRLLDRTSGLGV